MSLCSFGVFRTALACFTDEMEIISFSIFLAYTDAFAVLPDIAFLARNAMRPIIDLAICAANAVENPVFLLSQLFKSLLLSLYLCLEMSF
jgi:hypothetical protein